MANNIIPDNPYIETQALSWLRKKINEVLDQSYNRVLTASLYEDVNAVFTYIASDYITIPNTIIDGVNILPYQIIVFAGQTNPAQNGVYRVLSVSPTAIQRLETFKFDTQIENSAVLILEGTNHGGNVYSSQISLPFTIDIDPITFALDGTINVTTDIYGNVIENNFVKFLTTTATTGGTTTLTIASTGIQVFTGALTQGVVLPDATTLQNGWEFYIINQSLGSITIKDNGNNVLYTLVSGKDTLITLTSNAAANGVWFFNFSPNFETTASVLKKPLRIPSVGTSNNILRSDFISPIDSKKQNRVISVANQTAMLALVEDEPNNILLDIGNTRVYRQDEQTTYQLTGTPASSIASWTRESGFPNWVSTTIYATANIFVKYNSKLYVSKQTTPANQDPLLDLTETYWALVADLTVIDIRTLASRVASLSSGVSVYPIYGTDTFGSGNGAFYTRTTRSETATIYTAQTPLSFTFYTRNGAVTGTLPTGLQTIFNSTYYDNAGVITDLSANGNVAIGAVYANPASANTFAFLIGQAVYTGGSAMTQANAIAPSYQFFVPTALQTWIEIGRLVYRRDLVSASNFDDTSRYTWFSTASGGGSPSYTGANGVSIAGSVISGVQATISQIGVVTLSSTLNGASTSNVATEAQVATKADKIPNAFAIANLPTGGNIGTAVATVDIYEKFDISQTTASQIITLPNPTLATNKKIVYIANSGTVPFTIYGVSLQPNTQISAIYNGTNWFIASGGSGGGSVSLSPVFFTAYNTASSTQTSIQTITGTGVSTWTSVALGTQRLNIADNVSSSGNFTSNANNVIIGTAGNYNIQLTITTSISSGVTNRETWVQLVKTIGVTPSVITASSSLSGNLGNNTELVINYTGSFSINDIIDFRLDCMNNNQNIAIASYSLSITQVSNIITSSTSVGTIIPWAGTIANRPLNTLICDGSSLVRAIYSTLFGIIGTAFGTSSGTTFNLPDLRGLTLRGVDGGSGRDPNAGVRTALLTGGATGNNVGSFQADAFASHTHTTNVSGFVYSSNASHVTNTGTNYSFNEPFGPSTISSVTATGGSETRPKNVYSYFLITYQ